MTLLAREGLVHRGTYTYSLFISTQFLAKKNSRQMVPDLLYPYAKTALFDLGLSIRCARNWQATYNRSICNARRRKEGGSVKRNLYSESLEDLYSGRTLTVGWRGDWQELAVARAVLVEAGAGKSRQAPDKLQSVHLTISRRRRLVQGVHQQGG
jgi:hypothetical protein